MSHAFKTYNSNTSIPGVPHTICALFIGVIAPAIMNIFADDIMFMVLCIVWYYTMITIVALDTSFPLSISVTVMHYIGHYCYYYHYICQYLIHIIIFHYYISYVLDYYNGYGYNLDTSIHLLFPVRVLPLALAVIGTPITYNALFYILYFPVGQMHYKSGRTMVIFYIYVLFIIFILCTRICGSNITRYLSIVCIYSFNRHYMANDYQHYRFFIFYFCINDHIGTPH